MGVDVIDTEECLDKGMAVEMTETESCLYKNVTVDVIDTEECFSRGMTPYIAIKGEFNITKPYFYSNPNKLQKKKKDTAIQEAAQRHIQLRPLLKRSLDYLSTTWKIKEPFEGEKKVLNNEIDFPTIQSMVEAAHKKFTQEQPLEVVDLCQEDCDLDIFSIFNKMYINNTLDLKQLEITPTAAYLIPPQSSFIMGSMNDGSLKHLSEHVSSLGKADLVVMDPPWPNKSVRRSSMYKEQDIYDLYKLPIKDMIKDDSLVAIWVTNKPKFRTFVLKKLFPAWKLVCVSEWVWLKLTTKGECIFPLDSEHKKPYEQLIIGQRQSSSALPEKHVIASVPSVRHSRKPPLEDVLAPFLSKKEDPVCLEMFARCLTPGWVSWGNECLKFQHLEYFQKETI